MDTFEAPALGDETRACWRTARKSRFVDVTGIFVLYQPPALINHHFAMNIESILLIILAAVPTTRCFQ
jgi:hypothetical protein